MFKADSGYIITTVVWCADAALRKGLNSRTIQLWHAIRMQLAAKLAVTMMISQPAIASNFGLVLPYSIKPTRKVYTALVSRVSEPRCYSHSQHQEVEQVCTMCCISSQHSVLRSSSHLQFCATASKTPQVCLLIFCQCIASHNLLCILLAAAAWKQLAQQGSAHEVPYDQVQECIA